MALTAEEKARATYYLGYSALENNGPLVRALASFDNFPEATVIVREVLAELRSIDQQVADVKKVSLAIADGKVELRAHYSLGVLRSMGEQAVGRLGSILSVPRKRNVFAAGGPGNYDPEDPTGQPSDYAGSLG